MDSDSSSSLLETILRKRIFLTDGAQSFFVRKVHATLRLSEQGANMRWIIIYADIILAIHLANVIQ